MKRIFLFLATNLAVMLVLSVTASIVLSLLGMHEASGLLGLLVFSGVFGFGGAFISLFISKWVAKWSTGAVVIKEPSSSTEVWLLDTVRDLSERANLPMPEVAIYNGAPNAFATGSSKNSSLVAVSTGLLDLMDKNEVRAVLAHEMAHIQNGDMVTLTLIQGVVNTFVIFFARLLATFLSGGAKTENGSRVVYHVSTLIFEVLFGILASAIVAAFSRKREFRADAGAARLLGNRKPMQKALARLGGLNDEDTLPQSLTAFGFSGGKLSQMFASHPPIEARISALENVEI
mgnify:FL=1